MYDGVKISLDFMKKFVSQQSTSRGFTLIELLVVIAIIGVISSSVLAAVGTARESARDARRIADARQIMTALELYYSDNNQFPRGNGVEESGDSDFLDDLIDGGYISSLPDDPFENNSFFYEYSSYKNSPSGPCCQTAYIGFYTERRIESGDCPYGGRKVGNRHCHVFYPEPLNCSQPYNQGYPSDCVELRD